MCHQFYMQKALEEARKAFQEGEVPIGAVIVQNGEIVGRGHNQRETFHDPTAHAEILALRDAGKNTGSWRLSGALLYVTIEPCPMCAGALINSRIAAVIYGAEEPKFGSAGSKLNLLQFPGFNHQVKIIGPILEEECKALMQKFFQQLRNKRN
ncbi:MAG: tRNA adenosine(34) deaminase TadA [Peptococcaceae bacterium]